MKTIIIKQVENGYVVELESGIWNTHVFNHIEHLYEWMQKHFDDEVEPSINLFVEPGENEFPPAYRPAEKTKTDPLFESLMELTEKLDQFVDQPAEKTDIDLDDLVEADHIAEKIRNHKTQRKADHIAEKIRNHKTQRKADHIPDWNCPCTGSD